MSGAGWIGVWLLVAGAVAIVVEIAILVPMVRRFAGGVAELQELAETEIEATMAEIRLLASEREEMRQALLPYRRVLRVIRHPLVRALATSYRRRWRRP
jgi:hypothetical protein